MVKQPSVHIALKRGNTGTLRLYGQEAAREFEGRLSRVAGQKAGTARPPPIPAFARKKDDKTPVEGVGARGFRLDMKRGEDAKREFARFTSGKESILLEHIAQEARNDGTRTSFYRVCRGDYKTVIGKIRVIFDKAGEPVEVMSLR